MRACRFDTYNARLGAFDPSLGRLRHLPQHTTGALQKSLAHPPTSRRHFMRVRLGARGEIGQTKL
jgi:hypothetical protein